MLVIAHAASFLVLNSPFPRMSIRTGNTLESMTAWIWKWTGRLWYHKKYIQRGSSKTIFIWMKSKYIGNPNNEHSNYRTIWLTNYWKFSVQATVWIANKKFVIQAITHTTYDQNNKAFKERTVGDHLNTKLAWYSDLHCSLVSFQFTTS